ncbi:hypothetical protein PIB30_036307 [Stylosanthes scabra]|uniref:Uncharacterized protein n=1 Tax=Stylosanthes scabra TaxID=79078 RepID=A0ABU6SDM4_9FABA|nr:hypothetical protein [Stylosanthes scabra]
MARRTKSNKEAKGKGDKRSRKEDTPKEKDVSTGHHFRCLPKTVANVIEEWLNGDPDKLALVEEMRFGAFSSLPNYNLKQHMLKELVNIFDIYDNTIHSIHGTWRSQRRRSARHWVFPGTVGMQGLVKTGELRAAKERMQRRNMVLKKGVILKRKDYASSESESEEEYESEEESDESSSGGSSPAYDSENTMLEELVQRRPISKHSPAQQEKRSKKRHESSASG